MVEIWQANAAGRYAHPADVREDVALEYGFTGFGRGSTVDDGWFEFVTVKPGAVAGPGGGMQAPHILVGVRTRLLKRLVTRLYFPDEACGQRHRPDPLPARHPERETLVARKRTDGLRFDIRIQGEGETTFFAV